MCGIAGSTSPGRGDAEREAHAMTARLAHRGPGDRRVIVRAGVALGLARLHVVARSAPSGPYVTCDGAVAAAVNGEIWNHAEIRRDLAASGVAVPDGADTAVVAPLYQANGVAGLARLRGMFAAAIHDARDDVVVLARDRFGIKPLHYAPGPPLRFASEPGALPASGAIGRAELSDYLAFGCVPSPATFDPDVRQVPPGTALVFRAGRVDAHRFARPPACGPQDAIDPRALRAALERAVDRHRMGDVPPAVFVSGGLDSAVIAALLAALLARTGQAPALFALTFPGEGDYDEGPAARAVAAHLRLPLVEAPLFAADVPHLLDCLVAAHGGPFADASALATHALCREAARCGATVVLSGTGADELFAGYRRYRLGRVPLAARVAARTVAAVLPSSRRTRLGTLGALARKAARASGTDDAARYGESLAVVPAAWRAQLLGGEIEPPSVAASRAQFDGTRGFADAARAADLRAYLPDDLLAKEDRAAAAVALENRVQFLDDEVADLAGSALASAHLRCGSARGAKASLRAAATDLLPAAVLSRRKRGFGVPVSEWMRGPLRGLVDEHLAGSAPRLRDHLDAGAVADLVAAHRRGDDDLGAAVWALVVLEAALRRRSTL
ncbi:MAG: asparagine synthase (glutamine-hydrolyzing) [Planctomycetes bacterium]|nr:asparagine synthase (glutamine-hydrolyzing) [Planctomycetota bacterium]